MSPDNNAETSALRSQLFIQLVALVMVTGTLAVYLYRQASIEGKQLAQAQRVIATYNQIAPNAVTFVNQLIAFGEKNPDFADKVLKKYGIVPRPGLSGNAAAPSK